MPRFTVEMNTGDCYFLDALDEADAERIWKIMLEMKRDEFKSFDQPLEYHIFEG